VAFDLQTNLRVLISKEVNKRVHLS